MIEIDPKELMARGERHGFTYEVTKVRNSHYCGYVEYDEDEYPGRLTDLIPLDAPGGITYENDGVVGFDLAHAMMLCVNGNGDPLPGMAYRDPDLYTTYSVEDAVAVCCDLCDQLHEARSGLAIGVN